MGVDSGLPDFRGEGGFWNAYPPYRELGLQLFDIANPEAFHSDPGLAWGFHGHRLNLYRSRIPHEGFDILRRWAEKKESHFVLTSNVDGHFQKAGFDSEQVFEVHGSIHHLQCVRPCIRDIWHANGHSVDVDSKTMRARDPLPRCLHCKTVARPNIILFGDVACVPLRHQTQSRRYGHWLRRVGDSSLVIIELGAGRAIPTVRSLGEQVAQERNGKLVRNNPEESDVPHGGIAVRMGALEALRKISALMEE